MRTNIGQRPQMTQYLSIALTSVVVSTFYVPQSSALDYASPRVMALGGSGRAAPVNNDAIYLNPSFQSFVGNYSIAANYLPYNGDSAGTSGRNFNFSILDGRNELFQAGVGLTLRDSGKFVNFGASKALFKQFGLGVGAKTFIRDRPEYQNFTDFNVSMTGILAPWLQSALIVDNLLQPRESRPLGLYREFTLAVKANVMSIVMLYADPHYTPDLPDSGSPLGKAGFAAGAELTAFSDIYLRGGYFSNHFVPHQNARGTGFGLGAGWLAPRISIDYAYIRGVDFSPNGRGDFFAHQIGTTIFF